MTPYYFQLSIEKGHFHFRRMLMFFLSIDKKKFPGTKNRLKGGVPVHIMEYLSDWNLACKDKFLF
jgi:hypothetical protein